MIRKPYRLKTGKYHRDEKRYLPGDIVMMTDEEVSGFRDTFEPIVEPEPVPPAPVPAPTVVVESKASEPVIASAPPAEPEPVTPVAAPPKPAPKPAAKPAGKAAKKGKK